MLEYQNIKTFLRKAMLQISLKKSLWLKKVNTVPWTYVFSDFKDEEIIGNFYKKELLKMNQRKFRVEKVIKRKAHMLYVKWKGYDNSFNLVLIKTI